MILKRGEDYREKKLYFINTPFWISDSSAVIFQVLFSTYSLEWKVNSSSFFQYLVRTSQINISDFFPICVHEWWDCNFSSLCGWIVVWLGFSCSVVSTGNVHHHWAGSLNYGCAAMHSTLLMTSNIPDDCGSVSLTPCETTVSKMYIPYPSPVTDM